MTRPSPAAPARDVTPPFAAPPAGAPPFNVRTTVHEYGGLCYLVVGDTVYFSNFK